MRPLKARFSLSTSSSSADYSKHYTASLRSYTSIQQHSIPQALRRPYPYPSRSRCPSVTLHVEVKESSPILHILTSDSPFWDVPTNLLVVRFSVVHRAKLEEIWLFLQFVALKWSKGPRKASQTWEVCTRALLPYASRLRNAHLQLLNSDSL